MDRTMPTLRKVLRENDFETFIEKIEKIENLKDRAVSFATAILPCNRRLMFITASLRLFQD